MKTANMTPANDILKVILGLIMIAGLLSMSACNKEETALDASECAAANALDYSKITCTEVLSETSNITINEGGSFTTIASNNIPDHVVGAFPNSSNPNTIAAQNETYTITATPSIASSTTPLLDGRPMYSFGITLNGVELDPEAAEPFGGSNWEWNLNALSNGLGLDCNNAHVQPNGKYHYHGEPMGYIETINYTGNAMKMIGYAADGFPIYYKVGYSDASNSNSGVTELKSSYQLKSGERPGDGIAAPCGEYNGKYTNDYEYINGLGDLDECNGRTGVTPEYPSGTYYYVITSDYPVIPRYFRGTPDASFRL
jgi:hypothetical protein